MRPESLPLPLATGADRAESQKVSLINVRQLVAMAIVAIVLGFVGNLAGRMYTHHNEQHYNMEQAQAAQKAFNDQVIAAINQLAARVPAK